MDFKIGSKPAGRVVIELRADVVPRTAGKTTYTSSTDERIIKN